MLRQVLQQASVHHTMYREQIQVQTPNLHYNTTYPVKKQVQSAYFTPNANIFAIPYTERQVQSTPVQFPCTETDTNGCCKPLHTTPCTDTGTDGSFTQVHNIPCTDTCAENFFTQVHNKTLSVDTGSLPNTVQIERYKCTNG